MNSPGARLVQIRMGSTELTPLRDIKKKKKKKNSLFVEGALHWDQGPQVPQDKI